MFLVFRQTGEAIFFRLITVQDRYIRKDLGSNKNKNMAAPSRGPTISRRRRVSTSRLNCYYVSEKLHVILFGQKIR